MRFGLGAISAAVLVAGCGDGLHRKEDDGHSDYRAWGVSGRTDGLADSDGHDAMAALWPLSRSVERERVYVPRVLAQDGVVLPVAPAHAGEVPAIRGAGTGEGVQAEFFRGYREAGGRAEYEGHLAGVVNCESRWDRFAVSAGGHLGLAQFAADSWEKAASISGLYEWQSAYAQGYNVAVWISLTNPATQWSCW